MKVNVIAGKLADLSAEALVVALPEGAELSGDVARQADELTGGLIAAVLAAGDFKGKAKQTLVLHTPKGAVKRVLLVGLGKDVSLEGVRNAGGHAAKALRDLGVKSLVLALPDAAVSALGVAEAAQALAEGTLLSLYQNNEYRTKNRDELKDVDAVSFWAGESVDRNAFEAAVRVAEVLNDAITLTRDLIVRPGNAVTPAVLADAAKKMAAESGIKATVLEADELEKRGFGGLCGVGQGSVNPVKFIILEYNGGEPGEAPIAVVGKGITFDTGGISIKPSENMDKMKYDMGGGAATIGILKALASLKVKRNVVGLVPAAENMPSGKAIKPGDILTTYSGQTVEVLNTDAEGRLILCDALTYAVKDLKAQAVFDMATLTGACVIALGMDAIGVLGNHQGLVDGVLAAGQKTGDKGWQLPLWKEYNELLRSDIADMKNIGGREAGTITAACFLSRFVGDTPWVHLDIAGTAWTEKEKPYRPKGPTGIPVRMMVELIQNWQAPEGKGSKF